MATPIPSTRRVLSDLNVNVSPSKGSGHGTILGMEKPVSSTGISKSEVRVGGVKRTTPLAEDRDREDSPNKRVKSDGANIGARRGGVPEHEDARTTAGVNAAVGICSPHVNFPASPNAFGSHLSSPASSMSPVSSKGTRPISPTYYLPRCDTVLTQCYVFEKNCRPMFITRPQTQYTDFGSCRVERSSERLPKHHLHGARFSRTDHGPLRNPPSKETFSSNNPSIHS